MSDIPSVFESSVTYYDAASKKWIAGMFKLTDKSVLFDQDGKQAINIPLTEIASIEKKQSSLIYPALVLSVGEERHWFASFVNRDSVYNLVELFWRERLLSREHRTALLRSHSGTTDLGKDLLSLLHESENTLVNAANSLSDQGKQIEETQATVSDINTDLNVAEKLMKNMNFTQTIMQLTNEANILNSKELRKCFKVTFTFSENLKENCMWTPGMLFLGENISIVDESKADGFSVNYNDIISLEVASSWNFCLTYSDDNVKKSCYIACPKITKILKYLSLLPSVSEKILYLENVRPPLTSSRSSASYSTTSVSDIPTSFSSSAKSLEKNTASPTSEQLQDANSLISDEDIQEISHILTNLQELAFEVNREQQAQMEKISSLMTDVEKTELRMKADTKKIKKMI